jgi:hypothetical protein
MTPKPMSIMSPEQLREHLLDSEATLRQVERALRDFEPERMEARPFWFLTQPRRYEKHSR